MQSTPLNEAHFKRCSKYWHRGLHKTPKNVARSPGFVPYPNLRAENIRFNVNVLVAEGGSITQEVNHALDNGTLPMNSIVSARNGQRIGNITNKELYHIMKNDELRKKTRFYLGGKETDLSHIST